MNVDKLIFEVPQDIRELISEEKLAALIETFTQYDLNQDGEIGVDEFVNFFLAKEKTRLLKKFDTLDADQDGFIAFEEFVIATEPNLQILKQFRELDLDRNGLLSIEEAINIANQLVLPLNTAQIQTIMSEVDRDGDGDGQITYYEYLGAIAHIGFQ